MPQAVHVRAGHALHAVAAHLVGLRDGDALLDDHLDDLVVVGVRRQDDGGYVGGEVGELLVQQHWMDLGIDTTERNVSYFTNTNAKI